MILIHPTQVPRNIPITWSMEHVIQETPFGSMDTGSTMTVSFQGEHYHVIEMLGSFNIVCALDIKSGDVVYLQFGGEEDWDSCWGEYYPNPPESSETQSDESFEEEY